MVVLVAARCGGTSILGPSLPIVDKLVARLVDWVLYPVAPVAVVVDLCYCYYLDSYCHESTTIESPVLDAMLHLSRSLPDCRFDCYSETIAT
jgi:hypothetical protein